MASDAAARSAAGIGSLPAGFLRRLGALIYDLLLWLGVLFVAGLPLPLIPTPLRGLLAIHLAIQIYLLAVSFGFFGWFWTHGGQTLGMRAWRIRLTDIAGNVIDWRTALMRFAVAVLACLPAGAGLLWSAVDRERRAAYDIAAGTRLVRMPA